ncbi:MAG: Eco57I restriction-modification methylase domain-containing protein, partial [Candidatus Heimdallarchaeota archaeon]|nr:Eco57I restriction-modification methylase domain-containing protein [Candidatus Heimdallarchaeota archaeon]MCK4611272.1 Eco57I restriction-modification methylase domain-containing protein [Candidatus Heimdallarchaeota archaeon]
MLIEKKLSIRKDENLISYSLRLARNFESKKDISNRKTKGQFFTPEEISRSIVDMISFKNLISKEKEINEIKVLEPAAGTGTLIAALCEKIKLRNEKIKLVFHAYEIDKILCSHLHTVLVECRRELKKFGHMLYFNTFNSDFILKNSRKIASNNKNNNLSLLYDLVISNPPYFKIGRTSSHTEHLDHVINGQPNVYQLFIALSVSLSREDAQLIFITPRSYCSGLYFRKFRKWLIERVQFSNIHVFESRKNIFIGQKILQEIIIAGLIKTNKEIKTIKLSCSEDGNQEKRREYNREYSKIIFRKNEDLFIRIPITDEDYETLCILDTFPHTIEDLDIEVSTGRVVPFRTDVLVNNNEVGSNEDKNSVPLL